MTAVGFAGGCRDLLRRTGDTVFVVRGGYRKSLRSDPTVHSRLGYFGLISVGRNPVPSQCFSLSKASHPRIVHLDYIYLGECLEEEGKIPLVIL